MRTWSFPWVQGGDAGRSRGGCLGLDLMMWQGGSGERNVRLATAKGIWAGLDSDRHRLRGHDTRWNACWIRQALTTTPREEAHVFVRLAGRQEHKRSACELQTRRYIRTSTTGKQHLMVADIARPVTKCFSK